MTSETHDSPMREAGRALDHMLLGSADLQHGIDWMLEKTGVQASPGGSHPGAGTRNALLSLGNMQYIEIISMDPTQQQKSRMASIVQNLTSVPQLIAWAASTDNIVEISRKAKAAGFAIDGPSHGERVRPDGSILKWRTLRVISEFGDVLPFFIEWGAGVKHPSHDSPAGCILDAFEIRHPRPGQLRSTLSEFGIKAVVNREDKPRLKAILSTLKGKIEL